MEQVCFTSYYRKIQQIQPTVQSVFPLLSELRACSFTMPIAITRPVTREVCMKKKERGFFSFWLTDWYIYSRLQDIAQELDLFSATTNSPHSKRLIEQALTSFVSTCQKGSTFRIGRVQELYNQIIPILCKVTLKQPNLYAKASQISKLLVALEVIPEAWKQTQFWHVANFPTETW